MSKIGHFGKKIVFRVSDDQILTFQNMTYNLEARWGEVDRVGRYPRAQFLGPASATITMDIILDATLGIKLWPVHRAIRRALLDGEVNDLIIGTKRLGSSKWFIKSVSESWDVVWNRGELVWRCHP